MGLETVEEEGEAAFYGPKLDFMVKDALGRRWQLGTVQLDYNLPERFDLTYVDETDERVRPVMIHRAPFGSLERFIGVLIEHTGGNFPLWLAPTQVKVLPITDDQNDYAESVADTLRQSGLRVETDTRSEKVGRKIRDAEVEKVPVMLVVGRKEAEAGTVSVRRHGLGEASDQGSQALDALRQSLLDEVGPADGPGVAAGGARRQPGGVRLGPRATAARTGWPPRPRTPPAPTTRRGQSRRRRPSAPAPSGRGARA